MNLVKLRTIGDNLRTQGKYEDALLVYDTVREQIWSALGMVQNELTSFSQNYLGDSLRTAVQFKSKYTAQASTNTFNRWFNLDSDQTCNEFIFSSFGRLQCFCQSLFLCASVTTDVIMSEFLVLQTLILNFGSDEWVSTVNKIVTLANEGERVKKLRVNLPEVSVKKMLQDNSEKLKSTDWFNVNLALLEYMVNIGDTSSEMYSAISKVVGPYAHKYRAGQKGQGAGYGSDRGGQKKDKYSYEQYERYEKYERFERFEKRAAQSEEEFDFARATEYEKAKYFGKVLGLSGKVTKVAIKKRYLELIAKYHPDRVDDLGDELKALAEKKAKEINAAYEWMKQKYDL